MKLGTSLAITLIALKMHKVRTIFASLGIMVGIASVIVMVGVGKGSEREVMDVIAEMGENLITINAGEAKRRGGRLRLSGEVNTLTSRDAAALKEEVAEVDKVAPYEAKRKQVKFGSYSAQTQVSGSTPEFLEIRNYQIGKGESIAERDVKLARRVAVMGQTTVDNIFGEEEPLGKTIKINSISFTVVGVFVPKGLDADGGDQDEIILIPITTMLRRVINQPFIRTIYVKAASRKSIDSVIHKIRDLLRSRHKIRDDAEDDFTITSQLDIEELKRETSELFTKLIVGVAAISLVVGGIGILAVMLISVRSVRVKLARAGRWEPPGGILFSNFFWNRW